MIKNAYGLVMDETKNPLQKLPKMVRFQFMFVVSYMWSGVFSFWIGTLFWLGPLIVGHTALIIAIFFTAETFRRARGSMTLDHKICFKASKDGCARYDDIWGG